MKEQTNQNQAKEYGDFRIFIESLIYRLTNRRVMLPAVKQLRDEYYRKRAARIAEMQKMLDEEHKRRFGWDLKSIELKRAKKW